MFVLCMTNDNIVLSIKRDAKFFIIYLLLKTTGFSIFAYLRLLIKELKRIEYDLL